MSQTDRLYGLVGGAAIKVPCRAATTGNITLSAEQTIDGVAVVTGDRVLVKDQTDETENGIWVADTGDWERSKDFDGNLDVVEGTLVTVLEGTTQSWSAFRVTTADPVEIGSSDITFDAAFFNDAALVYFIQTGTGAVQRTAQSKMREIVSVTDFGATGDGTTDDVTFIQAAITSMPSTGGLVVFPKPSGGFYKCSTAITIPATKDGISLEGEHKYVQLRFTSTTGNGITILGEHDNLRIEDLDLYALNGSSGKGIASLITGSSTPLRDFEIIDVNVSGFLIGIAIYGHLDGLIRGGRQSGQGRAVVGGIGIQLGDSVNFAGNQCVVDQPYVQGYETCLYVKYCTPVIFRPGILGLCTTGLKVTVGTLITDGQIYFDDCDVDIEVSGSGYVHCNYHQSSTGTHGFTLTNRRLFRANENTKIRVNRATSNQTVADNTYTKVQMNAETIDTNDDFDIVTNFRFTARIPGYYRAFVQLSWRTAAADKPYAAALYKNGAITSEGRTWSTVVGPDTARVCTEDLIWLEKADYIEAYAWHNEGAPSDVQFGADKTFMHIAMA